MGRIVQFSSVHFPIPELADYCFEGVGTLQKGLQNAQGLDLINPKSPLPPFGWMVQNET
ncbi:hypothetical protein HYR69_07650 [Candidatus Sumerlaeota bacterium]|nr:hypothetical protein [Candidatus Sumerlaeota bacterium]MBI3735482.1 hypothetical protein [Candidatus Sumerlaeota bacterium]